MTILPWEPPPNTPGADRPPDLHVGFLFDAVLLGGHVHVKVRAATRRPETNVNEDRPGCGTLIMDPGEWLLLRDALAGAARPAPTWLIDPGGVAGTILHAAKIGPAGPDVSADPAQQFIEIAGWPDGGYLHEAPDPGPAR